MKNMSDNTRWSLIQWVPRFVCQLLWRLDIPLGNWAPHVLGRILGSQPRLVGTFPRAEGGDHADRD